jgi:hypothetical protein
MDFRSHLALCCKCNGFCEVLAASHDGATNRDAVQDHIEDGRLKFPWRPPRGVFWRQWSSPGLEKSAYSKDSFAFPACEACNSRWAGLEANVHRIVRRMGEGNHLAAADFYLLLDLSLLKIIATTVGQACNLSSSTLIAMVQTANLRKGNDTARRGRLYGTRLRAVLAEREMRSAVMMILKIAR